MKSVKDLYEGIIESEELKQKLEEAVKEKRVEDFLREQGCDATLDELEAFFKETREKAGELSDAELDSVAGGWLITHGIGKVSRMDWWIDEDGYHQVPVCDE